MIAAQSLSDNVPIPSCWLTVTCLLCPLYLSGAGRREDRNSKIHSLANAEVRLWYTEKKSLLVFVLAGIISGDTITILFSCKAKLQLHIIIKNPGLIAFHTVALLELAEHRETCLVSKDSFIKKYCKKFLCKERAGWLQAGKRTRPIWTAVLGIRTWCPESFLPSHWSCQWLHCLLATLHMSEQAVWESPEKSWSS